MEKEHLYFSADEICYASTAVHRTLEDYLVDLEYTDQPKLGEAFWKLGLAINEEIVKFCGQLNADMVSDCAENGGAVKIYATGSWKKI